MNYLKQTKLIMEYWLLYHIHYSFNHIIIPILLKPKEFWLEECYSWWLWVIWPIQLHQRWVKIYLSPLNSKVDWVFWSCWQGLRWEEEGTKDQQRFYIEMKILEGIFKHWRNNPSEKWTGKFETRVGVCFNKPNLKVIINQKV